MATNDAVAREAAWLAAYTPADGLPALLTANGGPFDVVQAYIPRTPNTRQSGVYVDRGPFTDVRTANQRKMSRYRFELLCVWPIGKTTATGSAETEQQNFDNAIELLIQRIRGLIGDHTHYTTAGSFLSVAEAPAPSEITVVPASAAQTMAASASLQKTVSYYADDHETII